MVYVFSPSFLSPLPPSFTMGTNDYGTYTCNSMNDCNGVMNTIRLEQCKF